MRTQAEIERAIEALKAALRGAERKHSPSHQIRAVEMQLDLLHWLRGEPSLFERFLAIAGDFDERLLQARKARSN